jgi:chromosome segregation ATPase
MNTAAQQLLYEIRNLEGQHDALVREVERKAAELGQLGAEIQLETTRLEKIRAEIQRVKTSFGV